MVVVVGVFLRFSKLGRGKRRGGEGTANAILARTAWGKMPNVGPLIKSQVQVQVQVQVLVLGRAAEPIIYHGTLHIADVRNRNHERTPARDTL